MNIVVCGYGAMGKVLVDLISNTSDHVVGIVHPMGGEGVNKFTELSIIPDVIIDFSHPSMIPSLLDYALENNIAVVIATTNIDQQGLNLIQRASKSIPVLYTKNTSLGINVLREVVTQLSSILEDYDIEIIEKHHNQKIDAPSGTAKLFVESIQHSREVNILHGRSGELKRDCKDVTVHAVRGGTIMGEHTILFAGDDEVIEIKHTALSKKLFAKGALQAAHYIITQPAGLYDMKDCF